MAGLPPHRSRRRRRSGELNPTTHQQENPLRRVLLLRHGLTDWNAERRWQGRADVPLNAEGLAQAEAAASVLVRDTSISVLVSSTARRASQTAAVFKGAFDLAGRPLLGIPREDLVEIDVGVWSGMLHSQVWERWPDEAAQVGHDARLRYGETGETLGEVALRARGALDELLSASGPDQTVLIVTHGAVVSALTASLLGWEGAGVGGVFGSLRNCHWAELRGVGADWIVERWNVGAQAS